MLPAHLYPEPLKWHGTEQRRGCDVVEHTLVGEKERKEKKRGGKVKLNGRKSSATIEQQCNEKDCKTDQVLRARARGTDHEL